MQAVELIDIAYKFRLKSLNLTKQSLTFLPEKISKLADFLEEMILDYNFLEKFNPDSAIEK